jgi:hypothetical protein
VAECQCCEFGRDGFTVDDYSNQRGKGYNEKEEEKGIMKLQRQQKKGDRDRGSGRDRGENTLRKNR